MAALLFTKEFTLTMIFGVPFALVVAGIYVLSQEGKIWRGDANGAGIKCRCLSYAKSRL